MTDEIPEFSEELPVAPDATEGERRCFGYGIRFGELLMVKRAAQLPPGPVRDELIGLAETLSDVRKVWEGPDARLDPASSEQADASVGPTMLEVFLGWAGARGFDIDAEEAGGLLRVLRVDPGAR